MQSDAASVNLSDVLTPHLRLPEIYPMRHLVPLLTFMTVVSVISTADAQDAAFSEPVAKSTSTKHRSDQTDTIQALLITGGCCHDYQNQKQIISEGLSDRFEDIEWTIVQYGQTKDIKADIYRSGDWIDGYDIVVHNECFGGVTDGAFVKGIVDAHKRTKIPAIVVHCSMHSYRVAPTADAWREFVGVTSRRHEKAKRSLSVVPTDAGINSAILSSLDGKPWQTPNGELYIIEKVWPGTSVLATAHSDETGNDEPVIWTNELNGVRVFGISLGHHNETMQTAQWQSTVQSGFDWALTDGSDGG